MENKKFNIIKTDNNTYIVVYNDNIIFESYNKNECNAFILKVLCLAIKYKTSDINLLLHELFNWINKKKKEVISKVFQKETEFFGNGYLTTTVYKTTKGFYIISENSPLKFTIYVNHEGYDTRKPKNDKIVNILQNDIRLECLF